MEDAKVFMNIHIERYIEEQGYEPIGEDLFECPGGHVWHIDDIMAPFGYHWEDECE